MKRAWYLSSFVLTLLFSACSEDEEVVQPANLTIQERIVDETKLSFSIMVDESVTEGTTYAAIQEEGEAALTADLIKNHSTKLQKQVSSVAFIGSFGSLEPKTNYVIYAFVETDGVAGGVATMNVTTK
ncbi:MAG: hypothetical protein ACFB15_25625 [Cyclobacteriaceae bacterium]